MPCKDKHLSSIACRCQSRMATLGAGIPSGHSCLRCTHTSVPCRISKSSNKCLECIWKAKPCDLAPIDIAQWRRFEGQRRQLKEKLEQSIAKQSRLLNQINQIKSTQQAMVETELCNIEILKREERTEIIEEFTVKDVANAASAFSDPWDDWMILTPPVSKTSWAAPGSSQGSWVIPMCSRM